MSMLGEQIKELRTLAGGLRKLYENGANLTRVQVAGMTTAVEAMREAADTIESLRDSLNEVADRWADTQIETEVYARENMLLKVHNGTRWHDLFGTPERAARTLAAIGGQYPCDEGAQDCDACPLNGAPCRLNRGNPEESKLIEWLRGDE